MKYICYLMPLLLSGCLSIKEKIPQLDVSLDLDYCYTTPDGNREKIELIHIEPED